MAQTNTQGGSKIRGQVIPLAEFGAEFDTFKREAFRLEGLQVFDVPEEKESFARFQLDRKAQPPDGLNEEWHQIIRKAAQRGAIMKRLRIAILPLADYLLFEIAWGYSRSVEEGEAISILEVGCYADVPVQNDFLKDFWLFDDSRGYVVDYDLRGRFLGVWKADTELVALLRDTKETLWAKAVPVEKSHYATTWGSA